MEKYDIDGLNRRFEGGEAIDILKYALDAFGEGIGFASSLGLEDQVITDMLCSLRPQTRIFTLDTGRLFPQAYELIDRTEMRYKIKMQIYFPDHEAVEQMVRECGINGFYDSLENRRRCCRVRKLEPLQRAFQGLDAWICGLRREQSVTREDMHAFEWDEKNSMVKVNPLILWHESQVRDYIREHNVPYNKLHDEGYPSIGCCPCTRTVGPGEDVRAGRWWWEDASHKECGLHK